MQNTKLKCTKAVGLIVNNFCLLQVEEIEGRTVAVQTGSQFYEISVAENSQEIYTSFDLVLHECRSLQATMTQKTRKFSVSKMIGTLIGNNNHNSGKMQNANQGGTVVVCHKSDLYKSRVLKRRQNFSATASLWLSESNEQEGIARWLFARFSPRFVPCRTKGYGNRDTYNHNLIVRQCSPLLDAYCYRSQRLGGFSRPTVI